MKTLDEIITVMDHVEFCCTNCKLQFDCDEVECFLEDALHYLKEYHDAYGNVIASMNHHLRKIHELEQNNPLTWDELRTMVGKPVWVELFGSGFGEWDLCHAQLDDRIWFTDGNGLIFDLSEETLGKTWQAYRKERE